MMQFSPLIMLLLLVWVVSWADNNASRPAVNPIKRKGH